MQTIEVKDRVMPILELEGLRDSLNHLFSSAGLSPDHVDFSARMAFQGKTIIGLTDIKFQVDDAIVNDVRDVLEAHGFLERPGEEAPGLLTKPNIRRQALDYVRATVNNSRDEIVAAFFYALGDSHDLHVAFIAQNADTDPDGVVDVYQMTHPFNPPIPGRLKVSVTSVAELNRAQELSSKQLIIRCLRAGDYEIAFPPADSGLPVGIRRDLPWVGGMN